MRSRGVFFAALAVSALFSTAAFAGVTISIDKSMQQMSVSVDGVKRYTWPVSTGRAGYATPSGAYTPFRLEEDHYSKEWDDAPMPHSIFFTPKGHAIHGSFETKRLGTAASHGCVRLAPNNAATLFALVKQEGLGNTKVVLTGEAAPMVARRPARSEPQGEPLELQPNQSRAAARPADPQPYGYQPYGTRSGSQQQYAVEPRYRQEYPAQPRSQPEYRVQQRYQQEYAAEPRYREPAYTQPYDRRPAYGQPQYPAYPRSPY
ncbi:MAG: L,D-transpeptidase family protein [Xanthobacteraceae bacterium]|jgi:L,D-transpeptidase catalytic domain